MYSLALVFMLRTVLSQFPPMVNIGYMYAEEFLDLVVTQKIVALIGPPCDQTSDVIGRLAVSYNVLLVSHSTRNVKIDDKNVYKTFVRTVTHSAQDISMATLLIMLEFGWERVGLMWYDDSMTKFSGKIGEVLEEGGVHVVHRKLMLMENNETYDQNMINFQQHARIIIVLTSGLDSPRLRHLIHHAHMTNMTSPDFVWLMVNLVHNPDECNITKPMNTALILESQENEIHSSDDEHTEKDVMYDNNDIGVYDSVYTYGVALNACVTNQVPFDNATAILPLLKWTHSKGFMSGILLNAYGDRSLGYSLIGLDEMDDWVLMLHIDRPPNFTTGLYDYIIAMDRPIYWRTENGEAPLSSPICGFDGALCETDNTILYSILGTLAVCGLFVALYVFKDKLLETCTTLEQNWKLDTEKLRDLNTGVTSTASMHSASRGPSRAGGSSFGTTVELGHSSHIGRYNLMTYDGLHIFACKYQKIKEITFQTHQLKMLSKIKSVTHENIAVFFGVANAVDGMHFVWQSPVKRTLRDTMQDTNLNLDDDFIASFMKDVVNGLRYIHNTLGMHGSLTSDTCIVDSRLVVRLCDYSTSQILAPFVVEGSIDLSIESYEMLHFAPEALREMKSMGISSGSKEADIYALAMILYEITTKMELFYDHECDHEELMGRIHMLDKSQSQPLRPKFPEDMSIAWENLTSIIEMGWSYDASYRPTIDTVHAAVTKSTKKFSGNIIEKMIHRMEIYTNNLEKVVAERTLEVKEQQERAERLLREMLPKSVADKLTAGLAVEPEWFDSASILFTDIVGFTTMAGRHTAMEVVGLLNMLYSEFDAVIGEYDAYKVETIGDAYMVVSGVPKRIPNHAQQISLVAIGMRDSMETFVPPFAADSNDKSMRIRLGCATGSCATGVIGVKMPKFCLFGDTVNFASRMESHGVPMKIQINDMTKSHLQNDPKFNIILRGEIEVKGKGLQPTYFIEKNIDIDDDYSFIG